MFQLFSIFSLILFFLSGSAGRPTLNSKVSRRAVSQDVLDQLTRFSQFSSAAYQAICPSPVGTTLVHTLESNSTSTQGYVARDDTNKQIIVAFRGSQQLQDFGTDAEVLQVPFSSQGVSNASDARAHQGFLSAYNSVASDVIATVSSELDTNSNYSLISTGHSLGGAIASIAGVSLASNFPDAALQVFTFGQPRTGNAAYAQLAESLIGVDNIFRGVHTFDGVPTIIPEAIGYQHHATEFWQFQEPVMTDNVKQCTGDEDPTCSASIPSSGINIAHITYFGQSELRQILLAAGNLTDTESNG